MRFLIRISSHEPRKRQSTLYQHGNIWLTSLRICSTCIMTLLTCWLDERALVGVFVCVNARATTNSLNLHILDYLHRCGYASAAHGLEQDVADLVQRATLPLSSNMILDCWLALFESHHARTLKPGSHMNPKFVDVRC